jgi:hypothetical protein
LRNQRVALIFATNWCHKQKKLRELVILKKVRLRNLLPSSTREKKEINIGRNRSAIYWKSALGSQVTELIKFKTRKNEPGNSSKLSCG